jgi:glycosyltransferase involved in cell wall biosynthesis
MPKVTVIIPSYNHAPFLDKRIQSVLNQTYQDFEVLIQDDCSTDNSREIIEEYAKTDSRIRTVFNNVNTGTTFRQWNTGVSQAQGEYIWIAESDDFSQANFLEVMVDRLEQFPSAGLTYCQSWIVDENNNILYSGLKWIAKEFTDRWEQDFFNSGKDECRKYLIVHNTIFNASAVVFRKAIYEQAGMAVEYFKYVGDWMQWVKMLLISDVVYVADHLNYFRKHQQTTRHVSFLDFKELREYYEVLKYIVNHTNPEKEVFKNTSLAGRWQLAARSPVTWTALTNLFKVYQTGKKFDPLINSRLMRYFKIRMTYKTNL